MRDEHITDILDGGPLARLGADELARVRAHAGRCAGCLRAYEAASAAAAMLGEHAAHTFEPPPFFQTKVMAALRERQAAAQGWSLRRLWDAAGALVATMAVTVAALGALTFVAPGAADAPREVASADAVEEHLFDQGPDEDLTDEQLLSTIYEAEADAAR